MSRPRGPTRAVTILFLSWLEGDSFVCLSSPSRNPKGSFGPVCPTLSPQLPDLAVCGPWPQALWVVVGSSLRRELGAGALEVSVMAQLFDLSPLGVPKTIFMSFSGNFSLVCDGRHKSRAGKEDWCSTALSLGCGEWMLF